MPLVMAVMVSRPRQECRQRVIKMMLVINNVLLPLLLERGQGYVSFITIPSRVRTRCCYNSASSRDWAIIIRDNWTAPDSRVTIWAQISWLLKILC